LESAVRYTAAELGAKGIRANAISPGLSAPSRQRDRHFDELLAAEQLLYPNTSWWTSMMSRSGCVLVSDGARQITGTIIPVDGGQHAIA